MHELLRGIATVMACVGIPNSSLLPYKKTVIHIASFLILIPLCMSFTTPHR